MRPSRRDFLRGLLAGAVMTRLGTVPVSPERVFTGEAGKAIPMDALVSGEVKQFIGMLFEDARQHLPKGTKFEVRLSIPMDFGRSLQIGWYASEEMQQKTLLEWAAADDIPRWVFHAPSGTYVHGRFEA